YTTLFRSHRHPQAARSVAHLHAPGEVAGVGDVRAELASSAQVALDPAPPRSQAMRIRDGRPELIDANLETIFHPHDAFSVRLAKRAQDLLGHPVLLPTWIPS